MIAYHEHHPSDHRWTLGRRYAHGPVYIDVIEPPKGQASKREGKRVPFGFARALAPAPVELDQPLLWEGD